MYIVFSEIHKDGKVERWYYGTWPDRNSANEVALELGNNWPVYHCVCPEEEAEEFGIQNMPKKRIREEVKTQTCCLCGKEFKGYGNNPWPVKEEGVCCDDCNLEVVIPARLERAHSRKQTEE